MTTLSPAAEAVFTAILNLKDNVNPRHRIAATALRAAADQVVPLQPPLKIAFDAKRPTVDWHVWNAKQRLRLALLTIANELEALDD